LLDLSPPLVRALRTALLPWGMRLQLVARHQPEASLPGSALRARALARELQADVLVWVSRNADGAALWMYEASDDAIRARPIALPLNGARAAALALSVKTWLRLDDEPPPAAEPPEPARSESALSAPALPALALSAPAPAYPPAARAEPPRDVQPSNEIPQPAPLRSARARVLLQAAAHAGALQPTRLTASYGVELRALGWRSEAGGQRLWLAARLDAAAASRVNEAAFRGSYSRWGGGLAAGLGQRLTPALYANLLGGATLDRATLSGKLLPESLAVERSRWQATLHLRPELELQFAPISLILQPALCASPRQQRFVAGGIEVLHTRSLWWTLGAAVGLDLF
jgi:hypothetical protein